MPFGLAIGTERAKALESAIQDELIKRGYSAEPDPVMAEYITIMIINNKTRGKFLSNSHAASLLLYALLTFLPERGFIDWLFAEAARGAPESELSAQSQTQPTDSQPSLPVASVREGPSDARRIPPSGPRGNAPLYQQAISQALPNQSPTAQKRTASGRSPSPSGQNPNKSRRTDLPSGPRAMRDARQSGPPGPRSLLERWISRPDNMQNNIPGPGEMDIQAAIAAGFVPPGMNGMDMNALAAAQMAPNPLLLQEMMMNQMAMMAQMARDVGMFGGPGGYNGPPIGSVPNRGRVVEGTFPVGRTTHSYSNSRGSCTNVRPYPSSVPTLCKFSLKCTNPHCRWSHPSPVATPESGMVLSNEPCEQGKDCKDKDCVRHTSAPQPTSPHNTVYCRYGTGCTRRILTSSRPQGQATPCRFGAACTRATCPFQHPEGRVLPSTFHRGLSATAPIVSVPAPQTGSMGAPTQGKALGAKAQEIEDERSRTIQAVKEAEAAAAKKDNSKRTPIAA
ncbi:hypothetical protein BJV77DRAFT_971391 [Russula vinacea]|nr:hypothetical protein BJV77DRAFT_971391 [Russula vinacea]